MDSTQTIPLKTIAEAAPIAPKNGEYAGYLSSDMTIFRQHGTKGMPLYLQYSWQRHSGDVNEDEFVDESWGVRESYKIWPIAVTE